MLNIHLFGKFRKFAVNSKATDDSVVELEFIKEEPISELLSRLGIAQNSVGEIFINHKPVGLDTPIPHDDSRIAIFPEGMYLLCGGQHLKGHGFIQNKKVKKGEYW